MKKAVTCAQMKMLDANAIYNMHMPSLVLMEKAALATVAALKERLKAEEKPQILVLCGSGNNGGDGIAVARILFLEGVRTEIFMVGNPDKMTEETRHQWEIASRYQVPVTNNPIWSEYTVIVDALFGVGLSREVGGRYAKVIEAANLASALKIAVDIPSGIHGDTGQILGTAFRADCTVTFAYTKRGLCLYPGRTFAGEVVIADIGIYDRGEKGELLAEKASFCMSEKEVKEIPKRIPWGNKGTFGKVLLIAGSKGMCGAAYLCASAALHGGAGMVKIQTVEENRLPLQTLLPEAMVSCDFDEQANEENLNWCDVLVIGPGLGTDGLSRERMLWFLEKGTASGKPLVLDADGLNLLAEHPRWLEFINENTILTPHIGEMKRLTGISIEELKRDPVSAAVEYATKSGGVCVLKDACTVTADGKENLFLNLSGNAGMATAGSGDVLSGIIAAVSCMYLKEEKNMGYIAALGVYIHGLCGDVAKEKTGMHGMTAKDIVSALPEVLNRTCQD